MGLIQKKKQREIQLIWKRIPSKAQGYLRVNPPYSGPWSKQTWNKQMNDFGRTLSFSKETFPSGSSHEFSGVGQSKLGV